MLVALKGDMNNHSTPLGLTVREAAWLLTLSEAQVRRRLASGALSWAVRPRLISVASVRASYPDDLTWGVRERALERLLAGEVAPPPVATRYARPDFHSLIMSTVDPVPAEQFEMNGLSIRKFIPFNNKDK